MGLSDKLARLSELHKDGALSDEEYQKEKARILSNQRTDNIFSSSLSARKDTAVSAALYSLAFGIAITVLANALQFSGAYFSGWAIPAHTFVVDSLIGVLLYGGSLSYLPLSLVESLVALGVLVVGAAGLPSLAQKLGATPAAMVVAVVTGIAATLAVALMSEAAGFSIFTLRDGGILLIATATVLTFGGGLILASVRARR